MNDVNENVDILLKGQEIEPNGLYDFSFRKVPTSKVPLYRGLAGQLTVNPKDKYRLQAWYGDELGHNEQVVLQSDLSDGTIEFSPAFKNVSVKVLTKEISNTNLAINADDYGVAVLNVSGSNAITLQTPTNVGTSLRLVIKNIADRSLTTLESEHEIKWSGSAPYLPSEINKFYEIDLLWEGSEWRANQNVSVVYAEESNKANLATTAKNFSNLVLKLTGAAVGTGSASDTNTVTIDVTELNFLKLLEVNSSEPKTNPTHIYVDTKDLHFWVYDKTTFKWVDCFAKVYSDLVAFDSRLDDLEALNLAEQLQNIQKQFAFDEKNISTNTFNIEVLQVTAKELASDISAVNDRTGELESRATKVEERATNLETRTTNVEDRATSLEGRVTANEDNISKHGTRISANETELADHENRITTNETAKTDHEKRITANETNINKHGERLTTAEKDISDLKGRATNLETRATDAENNITSLDARLTPTEETVSTFDSRITSAEKTVSDVSQRIDNIETTTDAGKYAAKLTELENKNTEQDTKLTELDTKLNEFSEFTVTDATSVDADSLANGAGIVYKASDLITVSTDIDISTVSDLSLSDSEPDSASIKEGTAVIYPSANSI